jgi:sugar phosphate isomerase/epimerase
MSRRRDDSKPGRDGRSVEAQYNGSRRRALLKSALVSAASIAWSQPGKRDRTLAADSSFSELDAGPAQPRFHLGLVTYNLAAAWDIETIISNCETADFRGVELRTTHQHGVEPSISKSRRADVKRRFADSRVRLVSLGTTCEYQSPDASTVEKYIEETRHWCELAQDLGCLGVKVRPNGLPDGIPRERTLDQIGRALSKCGEAARDHGVEIWMEVHGQGTQLPSTAHRILTVADHPSVGACWNSNPTDVESGSVEKAFGLLRPWIRSCHINNLDNRAYPWHDLFLLLRAINFDRYTFAEIAQPSCEPLRFMSYYRALWDYHTGVGRP